MLTLSTTLVCPRAHGMSRAIVAVIMDGNGRWATQRFLPRIGGPRARCATPCGASSRPARARRRIPDAVCLQFRKLAPPPRRSVAADALVYPALENEVDQARRATGPLALVGDYRRSSRELRGLIQAAEQRTAHNTALTLTIAANYGGRWDILQAMRRLLTAHPELAAMPQAHRRGVAQRIPVHGLCARAGSFYSHRRRTAHFQFPGLATGLY